MSLSPFQHHRPTSVEELLEVLAQHGNDAKLIAGGTELIPKMRRGAVRASHVVSLGAVPELAYVQAPPGNGLSIGANARIADVAAHPVVRAQYDALHEACARMATVQIRNMGTVAGNLANGSPCADTSSPLLVYDAKVTLRTKSGRREVPLVAFFKGPSVVDLAPGEILESIHVPPVLPRSGASYLRLSARSRVDIAAVGVAAMVALNDDGTVKVARIALNAVGPTPMLCAAASDLLVKKTPDASVLAAAAAAAAQISKPIDDVRATASYRRRMVEVLTRRALASACERARGGGK